MNKNLYNYKKGSRLHQKGKDFEEDVTMMWQNSTGMGLQTSLYAKSEMSYFSTKGWYVCVFFSLKYPFSWWTTKSAVKRQATVKVPLNRKFHKWN